MILRSNILKYSIGLLALVAVSWTTVPTLATGLTWKALKLINGWQAYANTRHPGYTIDANNFVHLRGAMFNNVGDPWAFTLPVGFRPNHDVYIATTAVNAAPARLHISADSGSVLIDAPDQTDAYNFTSLEGISFVTK